MISQAKHIIHKNARYLGRNVYHFRKIHSTNTELLNDSEGKYTSGDIVWADEQTAGMGRYQRHWVSDYGGLYFSILFEDVEKLDNFYPFVILSSLAILKQTEASLGNTKHLKIKWPNDIYHNDKKLSGLLVQSRSSGTISRVVVGIGININNTLPKDHELRNPAVSLSGLLGKPVDMDLFFKELMDKINSEYHDFIQGKFPKKLADLNFYLYNKDKKTSFSQAGERFDIIPQKFTKNGQLSALCEGENKIYGYGEIV